MISTFLKREWGLKNKKTFMGKDGGGGCDGVITERQSTKVSGPDYVWVLEGVYDARQVEHVFYNRESAIRYIKEAVKYKTATGWYLTCHKVVHNEYPFQWDYISEKLTKQGSVIWRIVKPMWGP